MRQRPAPFNMSGTVLERREHMRLFVLVGAVLLAAALAVANNLFNAGIPWLGSPPLLRQNPWEIIQEPHLTGALKGVRYGAGLVRNNAAWVWACAGAATVLSVAARFARRISWAAILAAWFRIAMAAMLLAA